MLSIADLKIAVIGLGYVGLPLIVEFERKVLVVGFGIYQKRIDELKSGQDYVLKGCQKELRQADQLGSLGDLKPYIALMYFSNRIEQFFDEMCLYKLRYFLNIKSSLLSLQR